jgi:hypothetical protein
MNVWGLVLGLVTSSLICFAVMEILMNVMPLV